MTLKRRNGVLLLPQLIKEVNEESANYPSIAEIEHSSIYNQNSLPLLLKGLFVAKGSTVRHAAIGQEIMQVIRTRATTPPSSNWSWCSDAQTL